MSKAREIAEEIFTELLKCSHDERNNLYEFQAVPIIASHIEGLEARVKELSDLYYELIMVVEMIYPGESRHQTALRYIKSVVEKQHQAGSAKCDAPNQGGGGMKS